MAVKHYCAIHSRQLINANTELANKRKGSTFALADQRGMFSVYAPIKLRSPSSPFAASTTRMAAEGDGHGRTRCILALAIGMRCIQRPALCGSVNTERINSTARQRTQKGVRGR